MSNDELKSEVDSDLRAFVCEYFKLILEDAEKLYSTNCSTEKLIAEMYKDLSEKDMHKYHLYVISEALETYRNMLLKTDPIGTQGEVMELFFEVEKIRKFIGDKKTLSQWNPLSKKHTRRKSF